MIRPILCSLIAFAHSLSKKFMRNPAMTRIFGGQSTTDKVLAGVSLAGKRILVTGVSAGLGVETARTLVAHGAYVVGTARDLAKARAATETIKPPAGSVGGLELLQLCPLTER
jgi:hypothetical protein